MDGLTPVVDIGGNGNGGWGDWGGALIGGAIHQEGEATRALIAQIDRERLLREMNAKDAEIASLKAQNFNTALANNNAAQTRADMQSMLNTILNHMTYKTPTTSGGGTTA
jgi:hypothetical protein